MSTKKCVALAMLAACVLARPALGSTKNPVERPIRCEATVTWTVNLLDGSATGHHLGVATHGGRFTAEGSAIWDLVNFFIVSGTGISTVANGDQLFWKMTPDQPMVIQFTGGTGRFEGATGAAPTAAFALVASEVDMATMTMTMTLTYTLVGTITY